MKKLSAWILTAAMLLSLAACGKTPASSVAASSTSASAAALADGTYTGEANGNNGPIAVEVTVKDGKLAGVTVTDSIETKGLGDTAMETLIETMVSHNTTNVDAVAGATNSSNGLKEAVQKALREAGADDAYFAAESSAAASSEELEDSYTYDVVIVGAGGAGLVAAVEAVQSGASVAVLEKTPATGGNTLVSGGGLNVPGSRQQIAMGIEDSVESFYEDTLKGGDNLADPALVRVMAENALTDADWLMDEIHVEFMTDRVQQFGGHSVPRALIPVGNKGVEMISKLQATAEEQGVKIFYNTRGTELVVTDGRVTAVKAENNGKTVVFNASKGVILTTGGFASDVEMRKQYNPNYDERFMTTATQASTGDGIKMAQAIGAGVRDMEWIQVYPTCNPLTGIISYVANSRFDGAILVNNQGQRFIDEMGRRDVISNAILDQPDGYAYLLWGQEVETVGNMTQEHSKEFEQWQKDDLLYVAESIEDAAQHYGIDPAALKATVDAYNASIADGVDEDFNRGGALRTLAEGPFYIQKVIPSAHHTMGGLTINTDAQVLDTDGNPIPGLYAAGEVTGGIHGTNRLGGNAITDLVVFGRIAGRNVVA